MPDRQAGGCLDVMPADTTSEIFARTRAFIPSARWDALTASSAPETGSEAFFQALAPDAPFLPDLARLEWAVHQVAQAATTKLAAG